MKVLYVLALIAWVIRAVANTQIFGAQIGFRAAGFSGKVLSQTVGLLIKLQVRVLSGIGSIFDVTLNTLHIEQIVNRVTKFPGLKQLRSTLDQLRHWNVAVVKQNCKEFGNFISSIILEHEDFFMPLFKETLNIFLTFTNALYQLSEGGKLAGKERGN